MVQQVGCEGFDYPDDPFILQGSCQLVYSLKVPRSGGQPAWDASRRPAWDEREPKSSRGMEKEEKGFFGRLMTWAALGVFGYVVFNIFQRVTESPAGELVVE